MKHVNSEVIQFEMRGKNRAKVTDFSSEIFGCVLLREDLLERMEAKVHTQNTVSWFELPAKDLLRAKAFYETIFGIHMGLEEISPESKMALFPAEQIGVHGAVVQSEGYTPSDQGTVVYLHGGEDLSGPLSKVNQAGGKVLKEKFGIGRFGYIAFFLDSEGNRVALHSQN